MNQNFHNIQTHILQNENIFQHYQSLPKDTITNNNNNIGRVFGRELTNYGIKQDETQKSHNNRSSVVQTQKSQLQAAILKPSNTNILPNMQKENNSNNNSMVIESGPSSKDSINQLQIAQNEENKIDLETVKSNNVDQNHLQDQDTEYDSLDQVDKDNYPNIQYVVPYIKSIFRHLRATETKYLAKAGYMSTTQTEINEKMRAILIDWLVDVHIKFRLLPETLFMTVNLIDRYLTKVPVQKQKLQLVGVSALLIAAKYEEIYPPEVKEFEYVTDKAYTHEEILDMEGKILGTLSFNLTATSPYRFLERYGLLAKLDEKQFNLARYLLELSLIEYKMIKYIPSQLTSAAIFLVNKIYKKEGWPEILQRNTKYTESQIKPCAKDLCILLQNASRSSLQAVRKKFASPKYCEISKIHLDKI